MNHAILPHPRQDAAFLGSLSAKEFGHRFTLARLFFAADL